MPRKKQQANALDALFAVVQRESDARRATAKWSDKATSLRDLLMPIQVRLESDPSKRKAVRSPRQTGKSTGVMLIVSIRCLEKALSEWVVICVTRKSAKSIYWEPLKRLNDAYELGIEFHNQDLEATFPNGSKIRFYGADNIGEIDKLRGNRLDGVVVDECKSYPIMLFDELIHEVLEAALMAKNGELILIGTPGDSLRGTFYLSTCDEPVVFRHADGSPQRQSNVLYGQIPVLPYKWSFHRWVLPDNITQFPDGKGGFYTMWDQAKKIMEENGWTRSTPQAAREYFGEWVPSDDKRVYRYRPPLHDYDPHPDPTSQKRHVQWGLPDFPGEFKTVLGIDLGTRDGTAMVVWAWNVYTNDLWEVYSEKRVRKAARKNNRIRRGRDQGDEPEGERLPLSEIAEWYHELESRFGPFEGQVADEGGLGVLILDTLAEDHQVYLEPAEKAQKNDHIEIMNNDFDRGRVHIVRGSLLSDELDSDRWDPKKLVKNVKTEDPSIPNDAADGGLYSHRWCRHRHPAAKPPGAVEPFTPEWFQQRALAELAGRRVKAEAEWKRQTDKHPGNLPPSVVEALGAGALDNPWWN